MPNLTQIREEINEHSKSEGSAFDVVRRKYIEKLHELRGRNIIAYYSGWMQKPQMFGLDLNDSDMNGFMSMVHELDRSLGLDLILHTPGGGIAATESIGKYLLEMFDGDIQVFVPQLAMSAGTMLACIGRKIFMGKQSSLGPIDAHLGSHSAHNILKDFDQAYEEIKVDPTKAAIWQPILANISPGIIQECRHAELLSREILARWLLANMFKGQDAAEQITRIVTFLSITSKTLTHDRHISAKDCADIGLNVEMLEEEGRDDLQDFVLSIHHAFLISLASMPAVKIIENQRKASHKVQVFLSPPLLPPSFPPSLLPPPGPPMSSADPAALNDNEDSTE